MHRYNETEMIYIINVQKREDRICISYSKISEGEITQEE